LAAVTIDRAIERIQVCYPQVYYACHTRHDRARSNETRLSARDSQILVHLDGHAALTLSDLAAHMDLSRSTLSEALTKLERLGYVVKAPHAARDRRHMACRSRERGPRPCAQGRCSRVAGCARCSRHSRRGSSTPSSAGSKRWRAPADLR
jgi:DNA-binding transcriptional ArsR family regulator